jgi:hypothetical protein
LNAFAVLVPKVVATAPATVVNVAVIVSDFREYHILRRDNQISDIRPLSNLTNLTELSLTNSHVSDMAPLVENKGLGEGDKMSMLPGYSTHTIPRRSCRS